MTDKEFKKTYKLKGTRRQIKMYKHLTRTIQELDIDEKIRFKLLIQAIKHFK